MAAPLTLADVTIITEDRQFRGAEFVRLLESGGLGELYFALRGLASLLERHFDDLTNDELIFVRRALSALAEQFDPMGSSDADARRCRVEIVERATEGQAA